MRESKKMRKGLMAILLSAVSISIFLFTGIASAPPLAKVSDDSGDLVLFANSIQQTADSKYLSLNYRTFSDNKASSLPVEKGTAELSVGTSTDWLSAVQEDIQKSEYNVTWKEQTYLPDIKAAYQAPNRAHNMRTYFTQEGIRVIPRTLTKSNWTWGLSLKDFGYEENTQPVSPSKLSASGNRIEYQRENLTEWYVNDERGIEQGFTIQGPPESGRQHGSRIVLKLGTYGDLNGTLNSLANEIEFSTAGGVGAVRYGELHAFDATGRELSTRFALAGKTVDILVDVNDALYPITIDPIASSPNWTAESNQAYAYFGFSVGTAGDVNGDGYSDVIVGAYGYDNGENGEGRAFVYYGSASGLSATPNWTAEANQANACFGYSVGTAGDVNGDGYSDVIVGARYFGGSGEGRAFVYHGSASGLSPTANWSADSGQIGAWFGWSVGTAGDVNGDGYSDVIVGAIWYDSPSGYPEGGAFVYHGSASGLSPTANWIAQSDQPAYFGWSVGTAGDVNGDGYSDVIVGAKGYSNGEASEGAAFVYYGSASGLSTTPNWTAESNQASAVFGCSVGTAGDVNGDGYSDVIVGAEFYNIKGRAFVYYGSASGLSTTANWIAETDRNGNFGHSVGTAGDVNGDGYSDVIIGAFKYANGESQEGAAFVYYGSALGLSTTADWIGEINQAGAEFGCSVGTAGDVNGDGASDIIIGAHKYHNGEDFEGGAFVYYGYTTASQWAKAYGGYYTDYASSIKQTLDGGYIGVGYFGSNDSAVWILKLDSNGHIQWQKRYSGTTAAGYNMLYSVLQTSNGEYVIVGGTETLYAGYDELFVLKLDLNGNILWQKLYGRIAGFLLNTPIAQTKDGGFVVAAYYAGLFDAWILKLDMNGDIQWQKRYGRTTSCVVQSIQQTADNGYIAAGYTRSFGAGDEDVWVFKLDENGNVQWQKTYGGASDDSANSVRQTSDGSYIVAGKTSSFSMGQWSAWVLKLDMSGNVQWQKTYDNNFRDQAYSIQQTLDGRYIVAGTTCPFIGIDGRYAWVLKLDTNGDVLWQKTYGAGTAYSIQQISNWAYIAAGETWSFGAGYNDALVLKLDANGDIPNCSIVEMSNASVNDTNASVSDSTMTVLNSNTTPQVNTYSLTDINATVTEICYNGPPAIGYSPSSFSFTATQGGSNPTNQTLSISNTGGGTLNWSVSDNATWLSLNPTSGTNSGTVTVSVNIAGLTAGTYNATITITATGATNSPVSIPVTLTINPPPPTIGYSPTSFAFIATQGGSNPSTQSLSISNTGGSTLNWSVSDNAAWLSLNPTSGTNSGTVTVSVNIAGLTAGTYNATITITAPGATNSPVTIPVSLTVNPPLTLLSPNGGEIIPSGSTYNIQWSAPPEAVKFDIGYSLDNGATGSWKLIAGNITDHSYNWTVPALDGNKNTCRVGVRAYNASGGVIGTDTSDNPFTIQIIKVTDPDGGEILTSGTTHRITWQTNSTIRPVQTVKIYGSPYQGQSGTWKLLTTISGNPGYYDWRVPTVGTVKDKCKIGVVLLDSMSTNIGQDGSDNNFTIQPAP